MKALGRLRTRWGDLGYLDSGGGGVPLVFLHGTGCDVSDWDAMVAAMRAGQRCVRMDFRGHGQSDVPKEPFTLSDLADDVAALAEHLKLDRYVVVGHSLGGMAGMDLAARSGRVAALVLVEGWTRLSTCQAFEGDRHYGGLDLSAIAGIKAKHAAMQRRFPPEVWQQFWRSAEAFDGLAYLRSAAIPICEVYGSLGRTASTLRDLLIPSNRHLRVVWLAGAGHYLPLEKPREVAQICAASAASIAAGDEPA